MVERENETSGSSNKFFKSLCKTLVGGVEVVNPVWGTNWRSDWPGRGTHNGPRWCTAFAKTLWTCFLSLRRWSTGSVAVDRTIENLTRSDAAIVSSTGLMANRKPNIGEEALAYAKHIEALAGLNTMVVLDKQLQ